jgi:predicted nucleic acid-binding protein
MIPTQDNEYAAILDACVLVPMCLCDTLLRLAEDPAMYRPLWSDEILREAGHALQTKIGLTTEQRNYRIKQMSEAFPEALVPTPSCLAEPLTGVPDKKDRHVLAAAIAGHANVIVTSNTKHFPAEYLAQFDILCHSADEFLIYQVHLNPYLVLEKLTAQAINIRRQIGDVLSTLKVVAPRFVATVEGML